MKKNREFVYIAGIHVFDEPAPQDVSPEEDNIDVVVTDAEEIESRIKVLTD